MSVIAKMNVVDVREFGDANLVKLSCVYENDGLNGEGYEDRRFTKATPWGEGDLSTPHAKFEKNQQLYLVFAKADDFNDLYKALNTCLASMFVRCNFVEPWPGTKHIEFVKDRKREPDTSPKASLNLRLAIDNEAASSQFEAGQTYYLAIYDAANTTLHEAAAGGAIRHECGQ